MVTFLIAAAAVVVMLVVVGTANTWWAGKQRRAYLRSEYYQDPALLQRIIDKEIWVGMTKRHLLDSQGDPRATDKPAATVEIYKYDRLGDKFRLRVRLENEVVTSVERDK